jgi:NaMN:DMB phosphoribosyltransferase
MSTTDALLLGFASLVAIRALVSMMRQRRDRAIATLRQQVEQQRSQRSTKKKAA